LQAELYVRRDTDIETDSYSEVILHLFNLAGQVNGVVVNENDINGNMTTIQVENESDMILFAYYIAECVTLKKEIKIKKTSSVYLRERIIHNFINLIFNE